MKNASKILIITLILVLSGSICVWAGEVTGLNEFHAGDPALASEVNGNFNAVKTAVDDNDAAITSNTSSIVTNAGNIADNATDIQNNAGKLTNRAGVQNISFSNPKPISSATNTEIARISISGTDSYDVSLTAHANIEVNGSNPGQYEFTITRGSTSGDIVGKGYWRPGSSDGYQNTTICFTGFDSNVTGPETYYLCARKYFSSSINATIYFYGLNAEWSKHKLILKPIKIP